MAFSLAHSSDTTKKNTLQHRQTYYSKTQANFFKAYAKQIQFVNRLNTLMTGMEKRKLIKVTEEVKTCNQTFRKYLNERRIVHIKIQDVIAFEQTYDKTNTSPMTHSSSNSNLQQLKRSLLPSITQGQRKKESLLSNQNTLSQKIFTGRQSKQQLISPVEKQMIKKGFMLMLEKLQTLKKDEFTNETKYLESVLIRECQKLKQYHLGMDDDAWRGPRKSCKGNKMNLVDEIDSEEKIHGIYPIIMKNIREETSAIEKAERTFEALINS